MTAADPGHHPTVTDPRLHLGGIPCNLTRRVRQGLTHTPLAPEAGPPSLCRLQRRWLGIGLLCHCATVPLFLPVPSTKDPRSFDSDHPTPQSITPNEHDLTARPNYCIIDFDKIVSIIRGSECRGKECSFHCRPPLRCPVDGRQHSTNSSFPGERAGRQGLSILRGLPPPSCQHAGQAPRTAPTHHQPALATL